MYRRYAGAETRDDTQEVGTTICASRVLAQRQRNRDLGVPEGEQEARRKDANDGERRAVQRDACPDDVRYPAESPHP